ncbi:ester cyclase [Streptomyces sp. NPDC057253]|uniref:ester cyclase n=1 Tax=Streptomyces sp. NPDC057253 TaxID=3346069 RepID=UPI00363A1161
MISNLTRMRAIDDAWNERDWTAYEAFLAPELTAWAAGDQDPHGRDEHVARAREFCTLFPENHVVTSPTWPRSGTVTRPAPSPGCADA